MKSPEAMRELSIANNRAIAKWASEKGHGTVAQTPFTRWVGKGFHQRLVFPDGRTVVTIQDLLKRAKVEIESTFKNRLKDLA